MNEFDKPPKIMTIRDLARKNGIPQTTYAYRVRKGLDPLKKHCEKSLEALEGMTQSEVARKFGVSRQRINERLRRRFILKNGEWAK